SKKELILTTEKDYMRLQNKLNKYALYYLPITTKIKNDQEAFFKEAIHERVEAKFRN
ncbi:MAG TPA: tetraacyldisaccharide 4'-kinase, partial [Flavobacteriaceae bacterium]|nr:tetraacyldisaccharide 4'-kinase [Flavobacteriaceae bacterium]